MMCSVTSGRGSHLSIFFLLTFRHAAPRTESPVRAKVITLGRSQPEGSLWVIISRGGKFQSIWYIEQDQLGAVWELWGQFVIAKDQISKVPWSLSLAVGVWVALV